MNKTAVSEQLARPLIVAHRGASALAPENTMAAFRQGISDRAEGVEFDVRLTKDGVPVVFHDATLKRVAGIEGRVSDLSLIELNGIDVGSWFGRAKRTEDANWATERIPTLAAVLELFSTAAGPVYLELKCDRAADARYLAEAACAVIKGSMIDRSRIIIKSFEHSTLPLVRRLLPDAAAGALFAPRLVRPVRPVAILETARRFEATHLSLHRSLVTEQLVAHARDAGMPVTAWTIDSPAWLARRIDRGLYAVITNDPARMLKSLT